MKTMNKYFATTLTVLLALTGPAFSATMDDVTVKDTLGTCKTDIQKKHAVDALSWQEHFAAFRIKEQSEMLSSDFIVWHSSLAGLATFYKKVNPDAFKKLPFPDSRLTCTNYVNTLAFLATANDNTKWVEEAKSVYCLDESGVTLDIAFSGYQVVRDVDGYIQYSQPYSAPATKLFQFNAEGKVSFQVIGVDSATSSAARAELQKLVAADPNHENILPKDEKSRGTFLTFAASFAEKFVVKCPVEK